MATSSCPKCGHTSFELKRFDPRGANFGYSAIQCSSCGAVVGVVELFYLSNLIRAIAKKVGLNPDNL